MTEHKITINFFLFENMEIKILFVKFRFVFAIIRACEAAHSAPPAGR